MREHQVAEVSDLIKRVCIIAADRRAGHIAAGHDEAVRRHGQIIVIVKEKHLHRCVGQHHADLRVIRRHRRRQSALRFSLQQNDRLLVAVQDLLLSRRHLAVALNSLQIPHHHRERLCRAAFLLTQTCNRLLVPRVAAQVESADTLDRDDLPVDDRLPRRGDRRASALRPPDQIDLRSAVVAADGLRVVAPGLGVRVLPLALRTHRKLTHTRALAVVGHRVEDRHARAAGRAVDERVHISSVIRIVELGLALVAGRDVGGDEDRPGFLLALDDQKLLRRDRVRVPHIDL